MNLIKIFSDKNIFNKIVLKLDLVEDFVALYSTCKKFKIYLMDNKEFWKNYYFKLAPKPSPNW